MIAGSLATGRPARSSTWMTEAVSPVLATSSAVRLRAPSFAISLTTWRPALRASSVVELSSDRSSSRITTSPASTNVAAIATTATTVVRARRPGRERMARTRPA